MREIMMKL